MPISLGETNNNPGNLRFVGQEGASKDEKGFAKFDTMQRGYEALRNQINIDAGRGHTLSSYITKFAPPEANDTETYITQAMGELGVGRDEPLNKIDADKLAIFQSKKESNIQLYRVQSPDGAMHIIQGPEGASDDDIIAQGQILFGHKEPSLSLLASRKVASRAEFEHNLPESTIATRGQAVGEGIYKGVSGQLQGLTTLLKSAVTGNAKDLMEAVESLPSGLKQTFYDAPKAYIDAISKGDWDEAAKQAGVVASTTIPATYGVLKPFEGYAKGKYAYRQTRPLITKTPEGHLRTALNPDLPDSTPANAGEQNLTTGGQMLKAGEKKIGVPVNDIETARSAAKAQYEQELWPTRRQIIDPQRNVQVTGSANAIQNAQIAALDKLRGTLTPKEYIRQRSNIMSTTPKDLTIGELEERNIALNKLNRTYHQSKTSAAMSKEAQAGGEMDIVAEPVTRQLMEQGMQKQGLGGYNDLKEVNRRIGSLIKIEDSIDSAESTARAQAAESRLGKVLGRTRVFEGSSGKLSARAMLEQRATINEGIANAMRTWKSEAEPIQPNLRPKASPSRQLPSQTAIPVGTSSIAPGQGPGSVTASPAARGVARSPKSGRMFRYYKGENK